MDLYDGITAEAPSFFNTFCMIDRLNDKPACGEKKNKKEKKKNVRSTLLSS